ncbi:predicted protein [Naegleria gruberi]|uniref:Predicted protein n=1 Tax=Naegleria gruberi TaxID=5762 RepID=D2W0R6_NAEGR|nr:uncharacterized protein NAEGRDRAFT_74954 [Naegleria gruberi]EFC37382.1 predicted protein [Naegleria gruberi]|eukprot:XP_002670126.1 predicted protein [Naegleria gruberi strain NEG-M]
MPKYGFSGGILSYLFFSIPGFIVCLVLGLSMYDYDSSTAPQWFIHAQKGLACSGIAFALQSMSRFSSMLDNEKKKKGQPKKEKKPEMFPYILLTIVAMVTLLYRKTWLLPVLLVIGAILSILYCEVRDRSKKRIEEFGLFEKIGAKSYGDLKFRQKLTFFKLFFQSFIPKYARQMREIELLEERKEEEPAEIDANPFAKMASIKLGVFLFILFFILLGCLIGAALIVESTSPTVKLSNQVEKRKINLWTEWIIMSSFFFKSGSLIFNGAVVNVVIIRDEMIERGWITPEQFINGYSLTNAAPGPRFNLGFYFGSVVAGNLLNSNYTSSLYKDVTNSTISFDEISNNNFIGFSNNETLNSSVEESSVSPFTKFIIVIIYSMIAGISFHAPGFLLILGIVPLWGSLRSKPIVQKAMNGINAVCVGYLINNIVILWISVVGLSVPLAAVSILGFALVNWIDFWHPLVVFVGAIAAVLIGLIVPI